MNMKNGINNFDSNLPNLSANMKDSINDQLAKTVGINTRDQSIDISDAIIRNGSSSYQQNEITGIYSGSFIVDLKKMSQSYKASIQWSKNDRTQIIGDTVRIRCLPVNNLIYGDFNCQDETTKLEDIERNNPILQYLPYSTNNFIISANINKDGTVSLNADIILYSYDTRDKNEEESINKYKLQIIDWIKSKDFNPDDFIISYKIY
ncbi:hypothetical protein HGB24_00490 [Candidatus Saccharibacteria bacterium]|nr:hypothetical protein [Candidatus Saccharibacteria bacterium]